MNKQERQALKILEEVNHKFFFPYALILGIVLVVSSSDATIVKLLSDVTCIKPQYILGWYLNYLLYCYVIFSVYVFFSRWFGNIVLRLTVAVSVNRFFYQSSPIELQNEQSLLFMAGVFCPKTKRI